MRNVLNTVFLECIQRQMKEVAICMGLISYQLRDSGILNFGSEANRIIFVKNDCNHKIKPVPVQIPNWAKLY